MSNKEKQSLESFITEKVDASNFTYETLDERYVRLWVSNWMNRNPSEETPWGELMDIAWGKAINYLS